MNAVTLLRQPSLATASLIATVLILAGCGRSEKSAEAGAAPSATSTTAETPASVPTPALQSALTIWQQGDKPAAVGQFIKTDWQGSALFAPGSAMNLSEADFKGLSARDRETRQAEIIAQSAALKQLTSTVAQAGRDAAAQQNIAQAREHFVALQQCGQALDRPESLALLKLVGQGIRRMAEGELAKLP